MNISDRTTTARNKTQEALVEVREGKKLLSSADEEREPMRRVREQQAQLEGAIQHLLAAIELLRKAEKL